MAPVILPTAISAVAADRRVRERRTSSTKLASLTPRVSGSAWTPWVRPIITVSRWRSACSTSAPTSDSRSASITTAASWSWVARAVATTSDDVKPRWKYRPASPTVSCTAATNAAMSCPCSSSSSAMRSASIDAPRSVVSGSTGIRPISAQPSHASNSTSSQRCSRDESLKIFAICCGAYRGITYVHSIGVNDATSLPLVIAHRGASRDAPANTPAAFEAAIAVGADAVELDVRRTADVVLVVHHNASRRGVPLTLLTYSALVRLSRNEPPRLDTVLDLCAGRIALDIEVKEPGYEAEGIEAAC